MSDRADVLPIDAEPFIDGLIVDPGWLQDQEIERKFLFYFVENAFNDVVVIVGPDQNFCVDHLPDSEWGFDLLPVSGVTGVDLGRVSVGVVFSACRTIALRSISSPRGS